MLKLIILVFVLTPVLVFSQSGEPVFKIQPGTKGVQLLPASDFLYVKLNNRFRLIKSASTKIDHITFSEGSFDWHDSTLVLIPKSGKTALLQIFVQAPDGKAELALVKKFSVIIKPEPKANLDGVDADSAIQKMRASAMGYLHLPRGNNPLLKIYYTYKIISFQMEFGGSTGFDTLQVSGNRLDFAMRDRVDKMKDGNVLQFFNVKYLDDGGDTLTHSPFRVYLVSDSVVKF